MSQIPKTVGINIGKNSFHVVGHDERGAIVLRQKWSRGQLEARFANMPPCLVGSEACVGTHHLSRKPKALGHDARLMPAKYVRPYFSASNSGSTQMPLCAIRFVYACALRISGWNRSFSSASSSGVKA
jgi:hypothetical protein